MIIPVITLYQPWATWVIKRWKLIETRTHPRFKSLQEKRIGIHAANYHDKSDLVKYNPYLTTEQMREYEQEANSDIHYPQGVFLGTVIVDAFSELDSSNSKDALIDCSTVKRYGLFLSSPSPSAYIPVRGSMGIWYFDIEKGVKVEKPKPKIISLF